MEKKIYVGTAAKGGGRGRSGAAPVAAALVVPPRAGGTKGCVYAQVARGWFGGTLSAEVGGTAYVHKWEKKIKKMGLKKNGIKKKGLKRKE